MMRAAFLAILCLGCAAPTAAQVRPSAIGGELPCANAPVPAGASEASLIAAYGASNVVTRILEDEGGPYANTQLFPDDPSRELNVRWTHDETLSGPASVSIGRQGSAWVGPLGLSIGDGIEEIERINGRPFEILGFGWDYGGQLWDTLGGALSGDVRGCRVFVFFTTTVDVTDDLIGDRAILSTEPALRAVQPTVSLIVYRYPESH